MNLKSLRQFQNQPLGRAVSTGVLLLVFTAMIFLSQMPPSVTDCRALGFGGERPLVYLEAVSPETGPKTTLIMVASETREDGWEYPVPLNHPFRAAVLVENRLYAASSSQLTFYRPKERSNWSERLFWSPTRRIAFPAALHPSSMEVVNESLWILGCNDEGRAAGYEYREGELIPLDSLPRTSTQVTDIAAAFTDEGLFFAWIERQPSEEHVLRWQVGAKSGEFDHVESASLNLIGGDAGQEIYFTTRIDDNSQIVRASWSASGVGELTPISLSPTPALDHVAVVRREDSPVEIFIGEGEQLRFYRQLGEDRFEEAELQATLAGMMTFDQNRYTPAIFSILLIGIVALVWGVLRRSKRRQSREKLSELVEMSGQGKPATTVILAGVIPRLTAAVIDLIVAVLVSCALYAILSSAAERDYLSTILVPFGARIWVDPPPEIFSITGNFVMLLAAIFIGLPALSESNFGRTLGKALLGIRVVNEDGKPPGVGAALARNLLRPIDVILLSGLITFYFSKHRQRLGDMAAGTLVTTPTPSVTGN